MPKTAEPQHFNILDHDVTFTDTSYDNGGGTLDLGQLPGGLNDPLTLAGELSIRVGTAIHDNNPKATVYRTIEEREGQKTVVYSTKDVGPDNDLSQVIPSILAAIEKDPESLQRAIDERRQKRQAEQQQSVGQRQTFAAAEVGRQVESFMAHVTNVHLTTLASGQKNNAITAKNLRRVLTEVFKDQAQSRGGETPG